MKTIMEAMAAMEGFYVPGTRPARNNNPGDIDFGKFAAAHGGVLETVAAGEKARFAYFPSEDAGFAAMRALLLSGYAGMTIEAAMNKWAPPVENQTNVYVSTVCRMTGFTPSTVLTVENIG